MTSASTGIIQMRDALKHLQRVWEDSSTHWTDDVRQTFEEEFIEPLAQQVRATLQAMDQLSQLAINAQQDCRPG